MTARLSLTLMTILALASPAIATAQTDDPTGDYNPKPRLTTTTPTTPKPTKPTKPTQKPTNEVSPETATSPDSGAAQTAPATAANADTTPSKLAYTGSNVALLGLIGLLALTGGVALMRSSRRA